MTQDLERILEAKDQVIDTLRHLVASQEARLSLQASFIANLEGECRAKSRERMPGE
ncbi:hypothetical protein [Dietzia timorensis]|uniref:hypothetical protein n=1 Tax=Dietzia timorensis TaxID=499555 RepID=UPI0012E849C1|nr:hypothetical protein [Dietzia timorensis]